MAGRIEDYALIGDSSTRRCYRQVGNLPQAFSHVPLVQVALNLGERGHHLSRRDPPPAPA